MHGRDTPMVHKSRNGVVALAAAIAVTVVGGVLVLIVGVGEREDDVARSGITAGPPTTTPTPTTTGTGSSVDADAQRAPKLLLSAADVPGFTAEPPDPYSDSASFFEGFQCTNDPVFYSLGASDDPTGASSPIFSQGALVPSPEGNRAQRTVASAVTFAASPDKARSAMASLKVASFADCFSRAYKDYLADDAALSDVSVSTSPLPVLGVGDESVGYQALVRSRLTPLGRQLSSAMGGEKIRMDPAGSEMKMYLDVTVIRSGRALVLLQDISMGTPFAEVERARLASVIAARMATL